MSSRKRKIDQRDDDKDAIDKCNKRRKLTDGYSVPEIEYKEMNVNEKLDNVAEGLEVNVGDKVDVLPLDMHSKGRYEGWRGGVVLDIDMKDRTLIVEYLRGINTINYHKDNNHVLKETESVWVIDKYGMDGNFIKMYESSCAGADILQCTYNVKEGEILSDLGYESLVFDFEEVDTEHEVVYVWCDGDKEHAVCRRIKQKGFKMF